MSSNDGKIIFSQGTRKTGVVKGDTYYRTLKANHFLKFPEVSIAVSLDVLDQLHALKVKALEFRNGETGTVYRCSLEHFVTNGVRFNRGFGNQVSLPLTGFVVTGKNLQPVYQDGKQTEAHKKQLAFAGWM